MKLKELMEKRALLITELEDLTKSNEFSQETFDEKRALVQEVDDELRALKETKKEILGGTKMENRKMVEIQAEELRAIIKNDVAEMRALQVETDSKGGFAVGTTLSDEIITETLEKSGIANQVKTTRIAGDVKVLGRTNSNAGFLGEMEEITANEFAMNAKELKAHRLGKETVVSLQLLNASSVDLVREIKADMTEAFANAIEKAIFVGTGVNQPLGITKDTEVKEVELASSGAITIDDVKKLKHTLKAKHQRLANFYMNRETFAKLDMLKDGQGRYLLQESVASETGYMMLGRPVFITDELEENVVIFLSPSAYQVNLQNVVAITPMVEKYAGIGAWGLVANLYLDGRVIDLEGVAVLK